MNMYLVRGVFHPRPNVHALTLGINWFHARCNLGSGILYDVIDGNSPGGITGKTNRSEFARFAQFVQLLLIDAPRESHMAEHEHGRGNDEST
jgi:hypothetical protein